MDARIVYVVCQCCLLICLEELSLYEMFSMQRQHKELAFLSSQLNICIIGIDHKHFILKGNAGECCGELYF